MRHANRSGRIINNDHNLIDQLFTTKECELDAITQSEYLQSYFNKTGPYL